MLIVLSALDPAGLTFASAAVAGSAVAVGALWGRSIRARRRLRETVRALKRVESDLLRTRRVVYADRAERALAAKGERARLPVEFTAEWGEDLFLWDLFEGKLTGTYIEVGAFDGHTLSVTYPFESVGWSGVLIEAIPSRYESCRARRPGSTVVHAALSKRGSAGGATFTVVSGDAEAEMLSYLSTNRPHERLLSERRGGVESVTVPLTTMDVVLERSPVRDGARIDFAIIDVEGGELDLLDGFDLERWRPRVLVVEDLHKGKDATVADALARRHYVLATRVGRNQVFARSEERWVIDRARALMSVLE